MHFLTRIFLGCNITICCIPFTSQFHIIIIKCPASWRWQSCLSKGRGLELPTSYPSLFQHPTRTSGCPAFFLFVFPCFFSCLVYLWWKNVPNPPFSLHGRKMLLVVFLSSASMICWFLPPSIPSHLFSSLSMVCATFFLGTTFLPPPVFSESACLSSMPHTRTSRSAGYSIEGLFVSFRALGCCWLGTVLAFGKLFSLGLFVMIFLRRLYHIAYQDTWRFLDVSILCLLLIYYTLRLLFGWLPSLLYFCRSAPDP